MDYGDYGNQYTTTSFGAQGGSGGGGFMAGGDASASPSGKGGYNEDTLRPMTIKQILDATQAHPDADFRASGADLKSITCVGQVRNIATQSTKITYKVEDGTGEIEATQWVDMDSASNVMDDDEMDTGNGIAGPAKPKVVLNGYVRVFGKLKGFNNKRYITAHVIRPVSDVNEVHCHFLEATAVHLFFARGPPSGATTGGGAAGGGAMDTAATAGGRSMAGMSPLAQQIFKTIYNSPQSNEGMHVQHLATQMNQPVAEVYKAGNELLTAGVIYPTVDDNTWAILEI